MKTNRLVIKFTVLFLFISSLGQAQERNELSQERQIEISAKLNTFTRNIESIQADFVQEKVFSFMDDKLIAEGKFWFLSPDKIRWEYVKPYPYIIIMSEGKMHVNDEGDTYTMDMRSNQLFQQMNSLITKSIQGKLLSEELNYDKKFYEDQEHYIVSFVPKDLQLKAYLAAIEIFFSKENGQVLALKMIETAGDYTFLNFHNRIENKPINSSYFKSYSNK